MLVRLLSTWNKFARNFWRNVFHTRPLHQTIEVQFEQNQNHLFWRAFQSNGINLPKFWTLIRVRGVLTNVNFVEFQQVFVWYIYSDSSFGSVIIITCKRPHQGALRLAGHSWSFRRKTTLVGCIPGLIKNNACKSQVSKGRTSLVIPVIMVLVATGLLVRCHRQGDSLVPWPARRWHLQLQIMILSRNAQIAHC